MITFCVCCHQEDNLVTLAADLHRVVTARSSHVRSLNILMVAEQSVAAVATKGQAAGYVTYQQP